MNNQVFLKFGKWIWLGATFSMALPIWWEYFLGHYIWQDFFIIICAMVIVSYWLPVATNSNIAIGLLKQKQIPDENQLEDNQVRRIRSIGMLLCVCLLVIMIARIISVLTF
ncbi:MAG: hypothetical protein JW920_08170, partial [Deltaproteobacteria bacterium]|nr:hypothetical protein [Deltaproteobacteria bacterium]